MFPELLLEQEEGSCASFGGDESSRPSGQEGDSEQPPPQPTNNGNSPPKDLASHETVQVRRVRVLLVGVILMGIAVSLGTYFFVNHEAENDYKISVCTLLLCSRRHNVFVDSPHHRFSLHALSSV